jgi:hypothetical protein
MGDSQLDQADPSKRHSNVAPGSFEVNPKLGLALVVNPEGPESIWDSGAVTSIANDRDAGVESMFPA